MYIDFQDSTTAIKDSFKYSESLNSDAVTIILICIMLILLYLFIKIIP